MFQMALMDINLVYVRQLIKLGLRDLTTRELIDLRSRNITVEYIAEVRSSGYDFSGADLIHLNDHGVESGFLRELRKAGYRLQRRRSNANCTITASMPATSATWNPPNITSPPTI